MTADLEEFRASVRAWCEEHIPPDWRAAQTGVSDQDFARFQKAWFAELHAAGFAGCIAETGTHDELTRVKGKYFRLVRSQLQLGID